MRTISRFSIPALCIPMYIKRKAQAHTFIQAHNTHLHSHTLFHYILLHTNLYINCLISLQIGFSTFATNIGATMFVGLPGSAASSGLAVTMFEWHVSRSIIMHI